MKNKRLSYSFLAVTLGLAVAMLFMGFAPFIKIGDANITLWDYVFKINDLAQAPNLKYRPFLIIAFALMIALVCTLCVHMGIKSKNFTGKKLDIVMLSCIAAGLVIASILVLLSGVFAKHDIGEGVKLGWGAITSGSIGILATGSIFTWFFTHPAT